MCSSGSQKITLIILPAFGELLQHSMTYDRAHMLDQPDYDVLTHVYEY